MNDTVYISKIIDELAERVLNGGEINRQESLKLINIEQSASIYYLIAWSNKIRECFHGNKIKLCSIINAKAGSCPEDCKFCAQSAFYNTEAPKYGFVEKEEVLKAMQESNRNGVNALAIVAAWKGLNEGKMLDLVCETIREMNKSRLVRPDASLGIIKSQSVADKLSEAGVKCYNHNLESSRRFFPELCTTHSYDERVQTIKYLKNAGIKACSGGIIGMGETREDRAVTLHFLCAK
jgi:biotin synthase